MKRIILLMLLFTLVPICSADVTVGVDYDSIEEALMGVEAGETIIIPEGVYACGLVIDKPVTLIGSDSILLANGSMVTLLVEADNVTLTGFTFAASYTGVEASGSGVSLEDCSFIETMIGVDAHGDDLTITGCDFEACSFAGLMVQASDAANVGGNNFNSCLMGALFSDSVLSWFAENRVVDCDVGVSIDGAVNGSFIGNTFSGCNSSFVVSDSMWNQFMGNSITGGVFLDLMSCVDNLVMDNTVEGGYLVQRYSEGNQIVFSGVILTGDMFSVSKRVLVSADYVPLCDVLDVTMLPDPVRGGAWVCMNISASLNSTGAMVPGTLGVYRVDDLVLVDSLVIRGGVVEASVCLENSGVYGCLVRVDSVSPTPVLEAVSEVSVEEVFYLDATGSSDDVAVVEYSWDFDDGETASGDLVQHYYSESGEYVVTLTVSDAAGHESVAIHNISVVEDESNVVVDDGGSGTPWFMVFAVLLILGVAGFYYVKTRGDGV